MIWRQKQLFLERSRPSLYLKFLTSSVHTSLDAVAPLREADHSILGSQPNHTGQSLRMAPCPPLTRSPLACQERGSINRKQMRNRDAQ